MKKRLKHTIYSIGKRIRLRTWVALGIILVLLPIVIFRVIYGVIAAPPVANTRWTFDEAQGTTAQDYSSNDNDGTVSGATRTEVDRCLDGNCLFFDGTDDNITRADDADMDFASSDSFTISVWYRHRIESAGTDIIAVKLNSADNDGGYIIQEESDGDITCAIEDDDADATIDDTISSTAANYDDNKWHYIACVKNATTSLTLYIDGVQVAQDAALDASSTLANDEAFYIGADNGCTTGCSNEFTGFMDEFRMYRSALTAAEILVDFNFGAAARFKEQPSDFLTEGLVGYWKLDEATNTTRADSSGNGNTLTETTGDNIDGVSAKFGNGGDFENSAAENEFIQIVDASQVGLDLPNTFTLAAWIKIESFNSGCSSCNVGIIQKSSAGSSQQSYEFRLSGDSAGNSTLQLGVSTDGSNPSVEIVSSDAGTFTTATWYHVAATINGSFATLYVNGVSSATEAFTGTPFNGTDAFSLGGNINNELDGIIDDARVYSRALSNSEVKSLYNWAPGPVAYYKVDENTDNTCSGGTNDICDYSGNGLDLAINASATKQWTPGKFGSALDINGGANDYASYDDTGTSVLDIAGSFSVTAWVYLKEVPTEDFTSFVLKKAGVAGGQENYHLGVGETTDVDNLFCEFASGIATWQTVTSPTTLTAGQWYHMACVYDTQADTFTAFLNGGQSAQTTVTADPDPTLQTGNGDLFLGSGDAGFGNEPIRIDEVKIYNYARSSNGIVEDMNGGHPIGGSPVDSQAVYWKLDEQTSSSTTAYDTADTTASNGTLTGATFIANDGPTTARCKINGCGFFDTAGDDISIAAVPTATDAEVDFNGSEKFSLATWIYVENMPANTTDKDAIITKWDQGSSLRAYRMFVENDAATATIGNIRVEVYDESTDQTLSAVTANDSIAEDTWYHVTMTFNGTTTGAANSLKVYLNGTERNSNSANASFLGVEDVASDFSIGDYDATDGTAALTSFDGMIDEMQVYSDELTPDQVKIIMNVGATADFGSTTEEDNGEGPRGYWAMDEGGANSCSGGANDSCDKSGFSTGNDGAWNGDATYTIGRVGNGVTLDGTNDYINFGTDDPGASGTDVTFEIWVKLNSVTGTQSIFQKDSVNAGGWSAYVTTTSMGFWEGTNSNTQAASLATGIWTHLAWVIDSGTLTYYKDGIFLGTDTVIATIADEGAASFCLGIKCDDSSEDLNAILDEAKIYNYARTQAQVMYDYNRGGPIAMYKMDDCTGTTVNDLSSRADQGLTAMDGTWSGATGSNTSAGTCTAVDTATAWYNGRNGKYNSSLDFDGTDDQVAVTNASAIDLNEGLLSGFTFATWIYPNSDGETDIGEIFDKGTDTYCRTDSDDGTYVDIECRVDLTTDAAFNVADACRLNQWCHVAFSWTNDADDEVTIWINGKPNASTATFAGDPAADANDLTIGGTPNFDGQIDGFRIYNYELSQAEVNKLMNESSGARFGPTTGTP